MQIRESFCSSFFFRNSVKENVITTCCYLLVASSWLAEQRNKKTESDIYSTLFHLYSNPSTSCVCGCLLSLFFFIVQNYRVIKKQEKVKLSIACLNLFFLYKHIHLVYTCAFYIYLLVYLFVSSEDPTSSQ